MGNSQQGEKPDQSRCADELVRLIEASGFPPQFREWLYIPLRAPGKPLDDASDSSWSALVLASSVAAGGDPRVAIQVAAAVELFMAAADVFDELEDGDRSAVVELAGQSQAMNVALALWALAQDALCNLDEVGVPRARIAAFLKSFSHMALTALRGQYLDIDSEAGSLVSPSEALEIARIKAGTLGAGACRLGAMVGTSDEAVLALYEAFGRHVATAAQLANDLRDASSDSRKSDLQRRKGTIPLVFYRGTQHPVPTSEDKEGPFSPSIGDTGAYHFVWVIAEIERQGARDVLTKLSRHRQSVGGLCRLLG